MPRPRKTMRRWEHPGQGRYLTFSCYRRLPLFNNDQIKQRFVQLLADIQALGAFELYAWVIMPEHAHLLVLPMLPDWPVSRIMHRVKRPLGEAVIGRWRQLGAPILRRINDAQGRCHFWQAGGGYDRNLVTENHLLGKINYIHENPVRRGLVELPTDWPWSSARWYDGHRTGLLRIDPLWG